RLRPLLSAADDAVIEARNALDKAVRRQRSLQSNMAFWAERSQSVMEAVQRAAGGPFADGRRGGTGADLEFAGGMRTNLDAARAPRPFAGVAAAVEIRRMIPVEDARIIRRAQGGDGRTVEAYATVFNQQAEIQDQMGHYFEVIDPAAFNRRLAEARRASGGLAGEIKVVFNHGMTRQATPSDRWSLPAGVPLDIRPDSRGLLTVTRYD